MESNFPRCLAFTIGPQPREPLGEEGGYANNSHDPGGATYRGVTLTNFRAFFEKPHATVADLKALTQSQLEDFYHTGYWELAGCPKLPVGVDLLIFETAVLSSPHEGVCTLQKALGVSSSGRYDSATTTALASADTLQLIDGIRAVRDRFYHALGGFKWFGADWEGRLGRSVALAETMARAALA